MVELPTDEAIRARIADDDPVALELIWTRYGAALHGFLVGLLRSRPDAEDVLQALFVRLAERRGRLARADSLSAYLFAMARNAGLNLLRSRARRQQPLHPDDLWLVPAGPAPGTAETADAVRRALDALPETQRSVVWLKIYEDLTFQQIAEALEISLNTAASRYRYALEKLRVWLQQEAL